jgi:hypothetical protein
MNITSKSLPIMSSKEQICKGISIILLRTDENSLRVIGILPLFMHLLDLHAMYILRMISTHQINLSS